MALASAPVVVDGDIDGKRLLHQLSPARLVVLDHIGEPERRRRARLADPNAKIAMQVAAPLEVRASLLDLAGERFRQPQAKASPALERPLPEPGAELERLRQRSRRRLTVSDQHREYPGRDLDLAPGPVVTRTALDQHLSEAPPIPPAQHPA